MLRPSAIFKLFTQLLYSRMSIKQAVMTSMLTILLIIAVTTDMAVGCYIRSCPMRVAKVHKRVVPPTPISFDNQLDDGHQCPKCGPLGLGQCIGPNTCCSRWNCWFHDRHTEECRKETVRTSPCHLQGHTCGDYSDGLCISRNICCTDGLCGPAKLGECSHTPEDEEELELTERFD